MPDAARSPDWVTTWPGACRGRAHLVPLPMQVVEACERTCRQLAEDHLAQRAAPRQLRGMQDVCQ